MDLSKLIWLAPPVIGLAAYFYTAGAASVSTPAESQASTVRSVRAPSRDILSVADLDFARAAADQAAKDYEEKSREDVTRMSTEELKMTLLEILAAMKAAQLSDDFLEVRRLQLLLQPALKNLVEREGATGIPWMRENLAFYLQSYVALWAERDPAAVLDHLATANYPNPCSARTLSKLIADQAAGNPATLQAIVARVPWELFSGPVFHDWTAEFSPDSGWSAFKQPEVASLWLKSGAALQLSRQGIGIDQSIWPAAASLDPGGTVAIWSGWVEAGALPANGAGDIFLTIAKSQMGSPEKTAAFDSVIAGLDTATREKIRAAAITPGNSLSDSVERLGEQLPALRELISSGSTTSTGNPAE